MGDTFIITFPAVRSSLSGFRVAPKGRCYQHACYSYASRKKIYLKKYIIYILLHVTAVFKMLHTLFMEPFQDCEVWPVLFALSFETHCLFRTICCVGGNYNMSMSFIHNMKICFLKVSLLIRKWNFAMPDLLVINL